MAMAKEQLIENVVGRVLSLLGEEGVSSCGYEKVDEAVAAAGAAQKAWQWDFSLEARMRVVDRLRRDLLEGDVIREVSALTLEETGMGRLDDKLIKKRLAVEKTPGPEFFATKAVSGDHGLVLEELSPFGVIASITLRISGFFATASVIGVSITPGQTALTRIFSRAHFSAPWRVRPITPCLVAT